MKRKILLVLVVIALMTLGLIAPVGADSSARPFEGSLSGEVTFGPVGLEICPATDVFLGDLRTDSAATGRVTHMGRTTMTSTHCTPAFETIAGGEMTLVAANDDEVLIHYWGSAPFPIPGVTEIIEVDLDFEIVGGTGHFDGAIGGGVMTAQIVFEGFLEPAWPAAWQFVGTIGY